MKIHLRTSSGNLSGMVCSNLYAKGRIVELKKFVEIPKEDRCMKCEKIASKFTSYI
jgi:hypothetical protein